MGDVIPLSQLRTLINLVPRFGAEADNRLTKVTALEWSSEYWLNKYFDKELFYASKRFFRSPHVFLNVISGRLTSGAVFSSRKTIPFTSVSPLGDSSTKNF